MRASALELRNICVSYETENGSVSVLKNVHLQLEIGTLTALTGTSGSGKTTLLNVAALLAVPTSGSVFINGKNGAGSETHRCRLRRASIGLVFQSHRLLADFTVLENVMLPLLLAGENEAAAQKRAEECLEKLGVLNKKNAFPLTLSGGEQQRVALARAIVSAPKILLADEPTGNLDDENAKNVWSVLQEIAKNSAVLVVTHNLDLAQKSDRHLEIQALSSPA